VFGRAVAEADTGPVLTPAIRGGLLSGGHPADKFTVKGLGMSTSAKVTPRSGLAVGFIVFAGVAMVMIGALHALQGLVALFNDDFFVVGQKWIFEFDLTTWGWIHLLVGLLVMVAGFFVFNGAVWARAVGIAVAALSAVLNFIWLPYYPIWGLIIIALDVLVVWALSVHGREFTAGQDGSR